jgi:hypothetical protein
MGAQRIREFDLWQAGYGGQAISIYVAGTTTLASVWTDEALTVAAPNPITLGSFVDDDGIDYGKFPYPIYTGQAYQLRNTSGDITGIVRPALTSLVDEDASDATVMVEGGSVANTLAEIVGRVVYATDYGALTDAATAANTTTLAAAIGAAAGNGGGMVLIPAGTYPFTQLTLSTGVVLVGQGRGVTILQSQTAGNVLTLGGDRCGAQRLTIDGVNQVASSVGVYSVAQDESVFDDVDVKRFAVGMHFKGGRRSNWRDLYVTNNTIGAKLHGDINAAGGSNGDDFANNAWYSGKVSQNTTIGVELSYEDEPCIANTFIDVGFEDNTGAAVKVNGARATELLGCWWSGNTTNVAIEDDSDTSRTNNTVVGFCVVGGTMNGGAATFTDTCQDVVFQGVDIINVDFTLTVPVLNNILFVDCNEDSAVTIAGDGTKFTRSRRIRQGASSGLTSDATATKAWSLELEPGQILFAEAVVIGKQRNGTGKAIYHTSTGAYRPGSALAYDTQSANFTVGNILTGGTSGATGRIVADSDSGTTGTLTLTDITGVFIDNETITDPGGGSATANGILVGANVSLDSVGQTDNRTDYETAAGWDVTYVANGPELELKVTGAASTVVEWVVDVTVRSS